jgi:hypothetical protein
MLPIRNRFSKIPLHTLPIAARFEGSANNVYPAGTGKDAILPSIPANSQNTV